VTILKRLILSDIVHLYTHQRSRLTYPEGKEKSHVLSLSENGYKPQ
jgi:hypothetical protein